MPRDRAPRAGDGVEAAPGHGEVLRLVAPNPGPMTLGGTNTYVVGRDPAYVIDPGPDDAEHLAAVRAAADRRGGIGGVLLTHGHLDHAAGVRALGAPLIWGTIGSIDEAAAMAAILAGEREPLTGLRRAAGDAVPLAPGTSAGAFTVLATPGHAADHACFVRERVCFCGDLILGQGSSIVPPAAGGGSLVDYMDSLWRVGELEVDLLAPGHGPWIIDPAAKVAEYIEHRRWRERRLVAALEAGERSRERLLAEVWDDVPEALGQAAAIAMRAHLEKLAAEGRLPPDLSP